MSVGTIRSICCVEPLQRPWFALLEEAMHHFLQLAFRLQYLEKRAPFWVQMAPLCRLLHVFVALLKWIDW